MRRVHSDITIINEEPIQVVFGIEDIIVGIFHYLIEKEGTYIQFVQQYIDITRMGEACKKFDTILWKVIGSIKHISAHLFSELSEIDPKKLKKFFGLWSFPLGAHSRFVFETKLFPELRSVDRRDIIVKNIGENDLPHLEELVMENDRWMRTDCDDDIFNVHKSKFENLLSLEINLNSQITDELLKTMTKLKKLAFIFRLQASNDVLLTLTQLEELCVYRGNPLLPTLTNLTSLSLMTTDRVSDDISNMILLKELTIEMVDHIPWDSLNRLVNLETLAISYSRIPDLSPIKNLEKLKNLKLTDIVIDIDTIGLMTNLETLVMRHMRLTHDIVGTDGWTNLTRLRKLACDQRGGDGCYIPNSLYQLTQLTALHLDNTPIVGGTSGLSNLSNLTNLTSLHSFDKYISYDIFKSLPNLVDAGIHSKHMKYILRSPLTQITTLSIYLCFGSYNMSYFLGLKSLRSVFCQCANDYTFDDKQYLERELDKHYISLHIL
jgi:hypothetical protein